MAANSSVDMKCFVSAVPGSVLTTMSPGGDRCARRQAYVGRRGMSKNRLQTGSFNLAIWPSLVGGGESAHVLARRVPELRKMGASPHPC
eukprot:6182485-Pleurochrysis_carterae.AAC.1